MKKFVWIVLIILAAFIAWRVIVHLKDTKATGADRGRAQMAVPVEVVEPEIGTVRDIGNFSGSLKPKSGYTLASGSSACAAAAAARRLGLVGDDVTVRMPGGTLDVRFRSERALLTGPVEPVFEGFFSEPLRSRLGLKGASVKDLK